MIKVSGPQRYGLNHLLSGLYTLPVFLIATACATMPPTSVPSFSPWTGVQDCFDRNAAVPQGEAAQMAEACSGSNAAANPAETGINRASAYFNAAAAYNALEAAGTHKAMCPEPGACSQTALTLMAQSYANQDDEQINFGTSDTINEINRRFVLRRAVEKARALYKLSLTGFSGASCGSKSACLSAASDTLDGLDSTWPDLEGDTPAASLHCEMLDLRWQVNSDLGSLRDHEVVEDLRQIQASCPALAAEATDKLSEIAFDRAERVRAQLLALPPEGSALPQYVEDGLSAISDYRDALETERFALAAHRGIGEIYSRLARLDAAQARAHLLGAAEAFETASRLSETTGDDSATASDLGHLGESLLMLAGLTSKDQEVPARDFLERAADALKRSVALRPAPERQRMLGDAYAALGKLEEAKQAYVLALPGLSGRPRLDAQIALSGVFDRLGESENALQTLQQAAAQGPFDPAVQYEIGRRQFQRGDLRAARGALLPAFEQLTGADKAEAGYMLSVTETALRPEGWQSRAVSYARWASQADRQLWKYSRQRCLATILNGGEAVKAGTSLSQCLDLATPEAQLLRGMYLLKQAQLMDVGAYNLESQTQWRAVLRRAEDAFENGQSALASARADQRRVMFDDLGIEIDLDMTLGQGLRVVQRCRRDVTIEPGSPAWDELNSFFGHYGVLKCS